MGKTKSKFIVFLKPALIIFLGGIFLCLFFNPANNFKINRAEAAVLTCSDRGPSCWIDSATVNGNTLYVSGGATLGYNVISSCPAGSFALCITKAYNVRAVDDRIDSGSWSSAGFNIKISRGSDQTCSLAGSETKISFSFSRDISGLSAGSHTVTVRVLNDAGQQTTCSRTFYKPPSCKDECSPSGKRECIDKTRYRICGNYDGDSCLEWSSTYSCGGGTPDCLNGYCRCRDECPYLTKRECRSPGKSADWHRCGYYDSDECLEWQKGWGSCGSNTVCYNTSGSCVNCECKSGYVECSETCDTATCVAECAPTKCDPNPCDGCQDLCGPNVPTLIAPPHNQWINYKPDFQARVSDSTKKDVRAYFNVSGYGDGWGSWEKSGDISSWGPVNVPDGQYWWRARAQNEQGSWSDWSGYWRLKKDTIKPIATLDQENGASPDTSIWVNLSESDERSGIAEGDVDVRVNGGSWTNDGLPNGGSTINNFTYTGIFGSTYEFRYRTRDNADNWSDYSYDGSVTIGTTQSPTATNLNRNNPDWCGNPPGYFFSWTYSDPDGDSESRFDFQVDNNSNFLWPEVDRSYTGLDNPSPSQNNQAVLVAIFPTPDYLTYNQTYYWRVRVYDSKGSDSGWVNGGSFTTTEDAWPNPDFSYSPESPNAGEEVSFTNKSTCYDDSLFGSPCNENDFYSWTFQDADPSGSSDQNPITIFQTSGEKQVTLTVTDSDGRSCPVSKNIPISFSFPKWKEIIPW